MRAGAWLLVCALPAVSFAATEKVFLTDEQALQKAFPHGETIVKEILRLTPAQKTAVERDLGWRLPPEPLTVQKGYAAGNLTGYAVIAQEIGKYEPITFMVKTSTSFSVEMVEVLVYREVQGDAVRKPGFLGQFRDKTPADRLRVGKEVVNVTGATLSVRAMAAGVRRVLCELHVAYGGTP